VDLVCLVAFGVETEGEEADGYVERFAWDFMSVHERSESRVDGYYA
jgi:hypothetical protein